MVRVLLLLEDFNELLFTETILKKVGFDVESAKSHLNLVEMLLGFNPEVLVVPGNGRRIILNDVLQQVRKQKRQPDVFVIGGAVDLAQEGLTIKVLSHPLNPKELLSKLADYGGVDAEMLLDKYRRAQAEASEIVHVQSSASMDSAQFQQKNEASQQNQQEPQNNVRGLKINLQPTTITPEQRTERFAKALEQITTPDQNTFNKDRIKSEKKSIRGTEVHDERSQKLETERKEFLKTLTEATPVSSKKMN